MSKTFQYLEVDEHSEMSVHINKGDELDARVVTCRIGDAEVSIIEDRGEIHVSLKGRVELDPRAAAIWAIVGEKSRR